MSTSDLINHPEVDRTIQIALAEDGIDHDLTTLCCDQASTIAHAVIIAKSPCIAAGRPVVERILKVSGTKDSLQLVWHFEEGQPLTKGDRWIEMTGPARDILRLERTILNYLMRMTGIATATHNLVKLVQGTNCKVLHTRKTVPGHRRSDIYAALQGGAHAHRRSLDDAILVKENHLRCSSSWQALADGIQKNRAHARFVEIEVTNFIELKHALALKPDRILLDNFSVEDVAKAVTLFGSSVELEASGGISPTSIRQYAETGVDFVSTGWITHSIPAADLSLLFDVKTNLQ